MSVLKTQTDTKRLSSPLHTHTYRIRSQSGRSRMCWYQIGHWLRYPIQNFRLVLVMVSGLLDSCLLCCVLCSTWYQHFSQEVCRKSPLTGCDKEVARGRGFCDRTLQSPWPDDWAGWRHWLAGSLTQAQTVYSCYNRNGSDNQIQLQLK